MILALALCCGCAGTTQSTVAPTTGETAAERAALARADAALERERPTVDALELRVRDLSVDTLSNADGLELALRLPFRDNPWLVDAQAAVWEAEAEREWRALDELTLARQVEVCARSVRVQADEAHAATYASTAAELVHVQAWLEAWSEAGSLDALSAAELELELELWLAREQPLPLASFETDPAAYPLPLLPPQQAQALHDDEQRVAQLIRTNHPAVARHLAEAETYRLEQVREQARAWPWLEFVELGYRLTDPAGPEHIAAQLAIGLPFGIEASAEEARFDALETSERLEADAVVEEHMRHALDALATLRALEASGSALREALEAADRAEVTARQWLEQRLGQPRQVARVFLDAYAARQLALEARLRAGEASCALLESTGTPLAAWPRQ